MDFGTINVADAYGLEATAYQVAAPISAGGPYQGFLGTAFTGPGTIGPSPGPAPALSLLGLVGLLVLWRVAIELGSD